MEAKFDHEKLRAYAESLRFVAWVDPVLENLPTKIAAREQLDRASTSIVLNLAEGNGKRSYRDRCRYFDISRGSVVECAACLDVLVVKNKVAIADAREGKTILLGIVAMLAGLIARFSSSEGTREDAEPYGEAPENSENDNE